MAEALMLKLGQQIGRQRAHDLVYEAAQASVTEDVPFQQRLAADPDINARLTAKEIATLLDPASHTGLCEQFAEREAEHARQVAAGLKDRIRSTAIKT